MSELALRREAVGRKNWLFVGSDEAGEGNARFISLLASCRLCDVEPWSYLGDIFCLLPRWPEHSLLDLAPVEWTKTRQRDDVAVLLEQNPFRKLTLDCCLPHFFVTGFSVSAATRARVFPAVVRPLESLEVVA